MGQPIALLSSEPAKFSKPFFDFPICFRGKSARKNNGINLYWSAVKTVSDWKGRRLIANSLIELVHKRRRDVAEDQRIIVLTALIANHS